MEEQEYILKLSLQQMALRKVAMVLWNQTDILEQVKSFRCQSITDDDTIQHWQRTVENSVKEKAAMLSLPDSLREELVHVIKPIGPAMLNWRMFHESLISDSHLALDQLCWTSAGRVDYRKTAGKLLRQEQISVKGRYKLACVYCLEDDIRIIWENMSEDSQNCFYSKENFLWIVHPEIIILWTHLIKGDLSKLNLLIRNNNGRERPVYQHAFERAAQSGNRAATEYFFQKLTIEEREVSLLTTALNVIDKRCVDVCIYSHDFPKENFCDVACYLLSQMSKENQIEVFNRLPYGTLRCFMDWPWQDLFMKVIGLMWSFLPNHRFDLIMSVLANNSIMTGYNYPKLFGELFLVAPSHYRKCMIEKHRSWGFWFSDLICGNQTKIVELVLRNVDDKDREGFITCEKGYHISKKLIEEGKWDLLELFVSECRLSSEAKTILKNGFMQYLTRFYRDSQIRWRKRKWERFFQLIDNANVNENNVTIIEVEKEEQSISNKPKRKRRRRKY